MDLVWTIFSFILGAMTVFIYLFILNFFNSNIFNEIAFSLNPKQVKVPFIHSNGMFEMMYKVRDKADGSIKIKSGNPEKGITDTKMYPDHPPHIDALTNRPVFVGLFNRTGNLNLLDETSYTATNQHNQMVGSITFELGKIWERTRGGIKVSGMVYLVLIIAIICSCAVIALGALNYIQAQAMQEALTTAINTIPSQVASGIPEVIARV